MPILREYVCAAHGEFEAAEPECPHGCSSRFVRQEFRTAPAYRSGGTARIDGELKGLAKDYGMSDIPSVREGESVMGNLRKNPSHAPSWGNVEHAAPGFSERGDAKTYSSGLPPGVNISSMKPGFRPLSQMTNIVARASKE
jgi:hypothetical protein